jgi:hypothetical protein
MPLSAHTQSLNNKAEGHLNFSTLFIDKRLLENLPEHIFSRKKTLSADGFVILAARRWLNCRQSERCSPRALIHYK